MKINKDKIKKVAAIGAIAAISMSNSTFAVTKNKPTQNFANIVLFAYCSDYNTQDAKKYFEDNTETILKYYDGEQTRSVKNYLKTISYGQFNLVNIFPQLDKTTNKINATQVSVSYNYALENNADSEIINEVVNKVNLDKSQVVDYDLDGCIDNVTVIIYGGTSADLPSGSTFSSHKSNYPGNKKWGNSLIADYNIVSTNAVDSNRSGVISHEFLHTLDYQDLYRGSGYSGSINEPVSFYDIMASSNPYMSIPLAYTRMSVTDWIDIPTITTSQTITLDNQLNANGNQAYIIKSPVNEYEFFVVEYRKAPKNRMDENELDGFMYYSGSGVIVYRVNKTVNPLSNYFGQTALYVFRPEDNGANERQQMINATLSQENGRTSFGSEDLSVTRNALTFSDGTNSGIVISNVGSASGDSITLDVSIPDASLFDMWNTTNYIYPNSSEEKEQRDKVVSVAMYEDKLYTVSTDVCEYTGGNKKLYTKIYDGNNWQDLEDLTVSKLFTQVKLLEVNNELYMVYALDGTEIGIKKLENNKWINKDKLSNIGYGNDTFSAVVKDNSIFIAKNDAPQGMNMSASILEYNTTINTLEDKGKYATGFIGQPTIVNMKNTIYAGIRNSSKNNELEVYELNTNNNTYTKQDYIQAKASSYDMTAINNKLYIVLGADAPNAMKVQIYDENNNKTEIDSNNTTYAFPKITSSQGNAYIITKTNVGIANTKVFSIDEMNNTIVQEGNDVSTETMSESLVSDKDRIYIMTTLKVSGKVDVKEKETTNKLQSLTIQAPDKTEYELNEETSIKGLKVIANYTNGSKEITEGYTIDNFTTTKSGEQYATVTYEGVSNTFVYNVKYKNKELIDIRLSKTVLILDKGKTENLIITYDPEDTSTPKQVTWSSQDDTIASVQNGIITAKKKGTIIITAKVADKTAICTVTVNEKEQQEPKNHTTPSGYLKGDLDKDGVVNANDAAVVLKLYNYGGVTSEDIEIGDMDEDGIINANDAALILKVYNYGYED